MYFLSTTILSVKTKLYAQFLDELIFVIDRHQVFVGLLDILPRQTQFFYYLSLNWWYSL